MKQKKSPLIGFEEFISWHNRYKKIVLPKGGSGDEAKVYGFLEHNENRLKKIIRLFQKTLPQVKNFNSNAKTLEKLKETIDDQRLLLTQQQLNSNFAGKKLLGNIFNTFFDLK
jgi:hypothetical protein